MYALDFFPRTFGEIVGQDKTILDLKKRSLSSYPEVSFFVGHTGSGKTSSAFLVAAVLNCASPVQKEGYKDPCGLCPSCKSIFNKTFGRDVRVFDGAGMGKQDVLDLGGVADQFPTLDKFKVLIVDEFQSASPEGKKAAEKVLEKKRKDTIFIFCMTSTTGVSQPVLDRAIPFNFKRLPTDLIGEQLVRIIDKVDPSGEVVPDNFITGGGLSLIVDNCDGSLRKALRDVERCINSELWTKEVINSELCYVSEEEGYKAFDKLIKKDWGVFEDIKALGEKNFFIYSHKILNNSLIRANSSKDRGDWRLQKDKALVASPYFWELFNLYEEVACKTNYFFNESIFVAGLLKYFTKGNHLSSLNESAKGTDVPVTRARPQ